MSFVYPRIILRLSRYNRILDASHGGRRDLLLSAVTAYNQLPRRSTGVSPETLRRSLRPPQPRWRQRSLTATTGEVTNITDAEWLAFLDEHAQLTPDAYAAAAQDFQKDLGELQNLLQSQSERSKLAQRVQRSKKTTKADAMPLLSGDIVLTRSTQYRSSCGHGKFESNADGLKTFRVLSISGQIAVLQDETTGAELQKHISLLKAMPRVIPASCEEPLLTSPRTKRKLEELQCIGPFWLVTAEADGGCLFRSMAMGRQWLHGVRPHLLQDNKANAAQLRLDVVQFAKRFCAGQDADNLATLQALVEAELLDETMWDKDVPFDWARFWSFLEQPTAFAGHFALSMFSQMCHISVRVLQQHAETGALLKVWEEEVDNRWHDTAGKLAFPRSNGNHFDLLVPQTDVQPLKR